MNQQEAKPMYIRKKIFLAGVQYRNPSLWKHYRELKTSEHFSISQLKELQEERLFRFLEYAGQNSPYYNNLFLEIGWKPGMPFTMELFKKIPEITKDKLISKNDEIHCTDGKGKLFLCETSGTSGQVLTFRRNESWDSFNRASIFRGYSWYGVEPWDYNLYFWGYNLSGLKKIKLRILDFLVNRFRMFGYSEKTINSLVDKISKATYIEGYSSMIYELACAATNQHLDTSHIKLVKGTSEKIYPHYVEKTKEVFGKGMISEYGSAETGIIAFECPAGNMHINMEGVYVEVDENNEIIVTNLHSFSFPVIRYRLGDAVTLLNDNNNCKCGMAHPVIKEVTGRIGKLIYGKSATYPSLTLYYIFKNLFFEKNLRLNYQAHQSEKGALVIWIKEELTDQEKQLIKVEASKYFKNDMDVDFLHAADFRLQQGKLRDFVSQIE